MHSFCLVLISVVFGFVICDNHTSHSSKSLSESFQEIANGSWKMINTPKDLSGVVEMGKKVKDAMEELLEDEYDFDFHDNTTEFGGIDASGCNRGLLKSLDGKCDDAYDKVNDEAQQIEDEREKIEAVCCALEDYEKCSLRAYDVASCAKDKAAIRENLKAARLFLSVVANITCTEFRGQCLYYTSAVSGYPISYPAMFISALISLATILP